MFQLSDEGQRVLRIAIFVGIAILMIVLYFIFSTNNNSEENNSVNSSNSLITQQEPQTNTTSTPSAPSPSETTESSPEPIVEEDPAFIEEFADLVEQRDDEAIEQEIEMYKSFIENYIIDVNSWNYETDLNAWSQDILNLYASDSSPSQDAIVRVSSADMDFCRAEECSVVGAGEFFNEEIPSYGGEFSGYFETSILTTDKNGNEDTVNTFWLVEAGMDEVGNPKIIYVEDMQTDSIPVE